MFMRMFVTDHMSQCVFQPLLFVRCRVCVCVMQPPGVAAGRVADSDREAGHWVMEFGPVESASH